LNVVILKRFIVAGGVTYRPSDFLEQLDFIDSPNVRLQLGKLNLYLCLTTVEAFANRNKAKVSFAQESYQKGYMAAKMENMRSVPLVGGNA